MLSRMNSAFVFAALLAVLVGSAGVAQAALLSNYSFNEGSGATANNSVVTAPAGAISGADWVAGKIGSHALDFDGYDYVNTTASGYPTASSAYTGTASFWIATESTTLGLVEYTRKKTATSDPCFFIAANADNTGTNAPGNVRFFLRTANTSSKYTAAAFTTPSAAWLDNNWHLLTVTWDTALSGGTNDVKFYLDGDSVATTFTSNIPSSGDTFGTGWDTRLAGHLLNAPSPANGFLVGKLDDHSVWGDQLTATEAKALYSLGNDTVLNYGALDAQKLYDIFAMGPDGSGTTSDGTTWVYTTGLLGAEGAVVNGHTALILDGFNGVQIIPEPGTLALLVTGLIGLLCYAWRKRK